MLDDLTVLTLPRATTHVCAGTLCAAFPITREMLVDRVRTVCQKTWHACSVHTYGSFAIARGEMSTFESDVDMMLDGWRG